MFAVVRTGGKQYKVAPRDLIVVEKLAAEAGASVDIPEVLMVSDGGKTVVGKPRVEGAKVSASVVSQDRADKVIVFKFKRRKKYRRTLGHRQDVTVLRIEEIAAPGMTAARAEPARKAPLRDAGAGAEAEAQAAKPAAKKPAAAKAAAKRAAPSKPRAKRPAAKSASKPKTKKD